MSDKMAKERNKMNCTASENETGRSLTEMLGVLAIMGILTIGGIAGFNYAMNKQRANATVDYVNQLAVLGTGQMLAGGTPKLLDYPDHTSSGYPAKITTDTTVPNAFFIEIDKVPMPVCDEIISRLDGWKMVNDIGFFGKIGACSDAEQVKMWFEITASADKGIDKRHCKTHTDCYNWLGYNARCSTKGVCVPYCGANQVQTPVGCCPKDKVFNGGCCSSNIITENGVKKCCVKRGNLEPSCCGEGGWASYDTSGNPYCISCDDPRALDAGVSWDGCKVCPNRIRSAKKCALDCVDPRAVKDLNGYCHCPMDLPVQGIHGECHSCDWDGKGTYGAPMGMISLGGKGMVHYCNRRGGGAYDYACNPGEVGTAPNDTLVLADDSIYTERATYGTCLSCDQVKISELPYKAQCLSCGGSWVGEWDSGSCTKP